MVATYTSNLRLTKQGDNDNPNTWGQVVNNQVIELIEDAISGVSTVDVTGVSDIDLSTSVVNGGVDSARSMVLDLTGVIGANINLIVPSVQKVYLVRCGFTGSYTVTIKPAGGSSGIVVNPTNTKVLFTNGTSIYEIAGNVNQALFLQVANNLSDLTNVPAARNTLSVYSRTEVDTEIDNNVSSGIAASVESTRAILPCTSVSTNYTFGLGDAGGAVFHPSTDTTVRTWTIPENTSVAFPVGRAITLINEPSAGNVNINIGGTDTLFFAGVGSYGTRTLVPGGVCTIYKYKTTGWLISGAGLL